MLYFAPRTIRQLAGILRAIAGAGAVAVEVAAGAYEAGFGVGLWITCFDKFERSFEGLELKDSDFAALGFDGLGFGIA